MLNLIDQVETLIHEQGGRMTVQRRLILETIQALSGHPTAEEIFLSASEVDESLHLSTVYRTLRWLEEQGLVTPRYFEEDRRQERFDTVNENVQKDHYHFRCQHCQRIIEFSDLQVEAIKKNFSEKFAAEVQQANLVLYGVCEECRQTLAKERISNQE